jgi:hypothetical protein
MTESAWLATSNPILLLKYACKHVSVRKLRLFGIACCHRIWDLLPDERSRAAVNLCEHFADHPEAQASLDAAWKLANNVLLDLENDADGKETAAYAVRHACEEKINPAICSVSAEMLRLANLLSPLKNSSTVQRRWQCNLLREIIGNPFRVSSIDQALSMQTLGTAIALARSIYSDKSFNCVPLLGDALEDAGCLNPAILAHCHATRAHVRGCWVVDLVLGKQ